jgi:hypothetical protein
MRTRRLVHVIAAVAATLVSVSIAVPASATPRTGPHGTLTILMTQTAREVLDLGATGTTVGDVVTGSGDLRRSAQGATIGTWTYRAETMRVNIPGGNENRLTTQWYALGKGSLMASGLISLQQGTRPTKPQPLVIVGGTGIYSGARGTMTLLPKGPDEYVATFRFAS